MTKELNLFIDFFTKWIDSQRGCYKQHEFRIAIKEGYGFEVHEDFYIFRSSKGFSELEIINSSDEIYTRVENLSPDNEKLLIDFLVNGKEESLVSIKLICLKTELKNTERILERVSDDIEQLIEYKESLVVSKSDLKNQISGLLGGKQ
jgi:hypothetical protein